MAGHPYFRSWRPSKRAVFHRLQPPRCSRIPTIHDSDGVPTKTGPVQSELLRFALNRTLRSSHSSEPESIAEQRLREIFLGNWPLGSSPAPLWEYKRKSRMYYLKEKREIFNDTKNLRELQQAVESILVDAQSARLFFVDHYSFLMQAMRRCERYHSYGEILAFTNGLQTRTCRLSTSPATANPRRHLPAIYYACLALSETALERHLQAYAPAAEISPFSATTSHHLVKAILSSLQILSFQDPKRSTDTLRNIITGDDDLDAPSLHSMIYADYNGTYPTYVGDYLTLLVQLNSHSARYEVWEIYLNLIENNLRTKNLATGYIYATALVRMGKPFEAVTALTQLSERTGLNDLPGIDRFEGLNELLRSDAVREAIPQLVNERTYAEILDNQLGSIERRLGIKWVGDREIHAGASQTFSDASEQPILNINGDSPGYASPERLVAEVKELGLSKSASQLSRIRDVLVDYEGHLISVSMPNWAAATGEFYWVPQCSPVEVRGKSPIIDGNQNVSIPDLGLIRVLTCMEENPYAVARSLHLIPLGYLMKTRPPRSNEDSNGSPELEETGHIVTRDRGSARFLAVFVGRGRQSIDATSEIHVLDRPSGLDPVMQITALGDTNNFPAIQLSRYHLDLDPCPDLILGLETQHHTNEE
ncbi:hypothetical protein BJX61DRAFT_233829 [Aspergillus egyptiacus]|nr:hypothetical protein BJX61DRAFT_233829 [Aspergillus egyptiacus]